MADNRKNSTKSRKQTNPNSLANLIPGNPKGGRKPVPQEFKDLAEGYSVTALRKVIEIIEDPETKPTDKLKAIEIVLDRGIGKPTLPVDIGGDMEFTIKLPNFKVE